MANLWVTLNSIKLFPALPMDRDDDPVGNRYERRSGNRRFYWRADKATWVLTHTNATEALVTTWRNASPRNTSLTYIDIDGVSYTVRVTRRRFTVIRTKPNVNGSATATGPAFYRIEISLEQL